MVASATPRENAFNVFVWDSAVTYHPVWYLHVVFSLKFQMLIPFRLQLSYCLYAACLQAEH